MTPLSDVTMSPLIVLSRGTCAVFEKDMDNFRVLLVQRHVQRCHSKVVMGCCICPVPEK